MFPKLRNLIYVFFLWTALLAFPSTPSEAGTNCDTLKNVLKREMTAGYAFLSTAITNRSLVVLFLVNQTGHWEIIGVEDDQQACVIAKGSEWTFAMEKAL